MKKICSFNKIEEILKTHKKEIFEKYKLKEIGIFGSYVRERQKRSSDVDILVEFKEAPDLFKFFEIERYLERLLKRKVDLVRKKALRPELKNLILRELVRI